MIWPFSSNKLRSKSYLCNKYGYGFHYFIRLMTFKTSKSTVTTLTGVNLACSAGVFHRRALNINLVRVFEGGRFLLLQSLQERNYPLGVWQRRRTNGCCWTIARNGEIGQVPSSQVPCSRVPCSRVPCSQARKEFNASSIHPVKGKRAIFSKWPSKFAQNKFYCFGSL